MLERISVNEFSTSKWSFFRDVIQYASRGINQIGLWRAKVEDFGTPAAIDLLYEMKMSVSSVNWIGGFTGSDGRTFVEAVEDSVEAIHLASRVNANCLVLHPGGRNGHTRRHARRLVETALKTLIPIADDFGVRIAIEPIPRGNGTPWTFQSYQECLELTNEFAPQELGIVLDLYHAGLNASMFDRLPEFADRICLVQVADRLTSDTNFICEHGLQGRDRRLAPGEGDIEIDRWLSALTAHGYTGPLELELHGKYFDDFDYGQTLDQFGCFLESKAGLITGKSQMKQFDR